MLWEDHSRLLAGLAARLIFAFGPLSLFWERIAGGAICGRVMESTIREACPGYFLLIAGKSSKREAT